MVAKGANMGRVGGGGVGGGGVRTRSMFCTFIRLAGSIKRMLWYCADGHV